MNNKVEDMLRDQFLLAEYKHFTESFWKSEELGEKRVDFFITLCTAVIAGLVALAKNGENTEPTIELIAIVSLIGLLLFGVITFLRMLKRNRVTDEYINIIEHIREEIKNQSPDLIYYNIPLNKDKKWYLRAGLAESVGIINSFILALLVPIFAKWYCNEKLLFGESPYEVGIIVCIISFVFHYGLSCWSRK